MVRLLGGPSTVCRWNRRHRISHAPPRAGNAPAVSPTCPARVHAAWHTLARDWHTPAPSVAPRVRQGQHSCECTQNLKDLKFEMI
uniref:Uncharacterized protein n=1 Tax=Fagus sylvatica TaxID=28930 RepID=A0A2N9IS28_FAGSY